MHFAALQSAQESADPAIEVAALTKVYKRLVAVDHLSFSVARGSVTGLLGGNGAG
ncbi:MAG: ABC transporter ATP-binding protein, partial [Methylovirgula sp.]